MWTGSNIYDLLPMGAQPCDDENGVRHSAQKAGSEKLIHCKKKAVGFIHGVHCLFIDVPTIS